MWWALCGDRVSHLGACGQAAVTCVLVYYRRVGGGSPCWRVPFSNFYGLPGYLYYVLRNQTSLSYGWESGDPAEDERFVLLSRVLMYEWIVGVCLAASR
jgi:hypothetical protein